MSRNGDKQAYPVLGAAEWISLAAAPTFAIMAVLTGTLGGGSPDTFCSAAHRASPLSGMVLMYLLMSAFDSASWLDPRQRVVTKNLPSRLRDGRIIKRPDI
jgi:hypothetical protein